MIVACRGRRSYFSLKFLSPPPPMNIVLSNTMNSPLVQAQEIMAKWNDKVLATENTKIRLLLDKSSQTTHIPDQTAPWCLPIQKKRNGSPFRSLSHCKQHNRDSREISCFRSHNLACRAAHAWPHITSSQKLDGWICLFIAKKVGGAACSVGLVFWVK